MKTKIKRIGYSIASAAVLAAPLVVLAQFDRPGGTNLPEGRMFDIVTNAMMWLLAIVGIIGVIGFAIAGILYLTAAGDETRIEKAKSAMLMSIIGVVVALVGLVIMRAVQTWLGGSASRF
ncbi:MAG: hypothetical protein NT136_00760 [Candidatus Moranbacteria bacterium]|nr:hypothetical protein [Candidatus Moranbacteria bacterium]